MQVEKAPIPNKIKIGIAWRAFTPPPLSQMGRVILFQTDDYDDDFDDYDHEND